MTLVINPCHGFSVIASGVAMGNKFISGDNETGEKLSPATTTPAINLLPVTKTETIAGRVRVRRLEISSLLVLSSFCSLIRVCEVSMDAPFHRSSIDTIGGYVRLQLCLTSPFWFEEVFAASRASDQKV
jgi:hypothetical protein